MIKKINLFGAENFNTMVEVFLGLILLCMITGFAFQMHKVDNWWTQMTGMYLVGLSFAYLFGRLGIKPIKQSFFNLISLILLILTTIFLSGFSLIMLKTGLVVVLVPVGLSAIALIVALSLFGIPFLMYSFVNRK